MWNNELISGITIGAAATVPIIVAIVQVFKMTGWIQDKYSPIVSIITGILISCLLGQDTNSWNVNILAGILYGLASSGLYSTVKSTAHAIKKDRHELDQETKNK